MPKVQAAKVGGWGAVERKAQSWQNRAVCEEVQPKLWVVRVDGLPIGVIGKDPWCEAEVVRWAKMFEEQYLENKP